MEINIKDLQKILKSFNKETKLNIQSLIDGIKEAITKVYLKQINAVEEAVVDVEVNQNTGNIKAFHVVKAVNKIEEPSIEMLVSEAKKYKKDVVAGDDVRVPIDINLFSRTTINYVKNALSSKIKDDKKTKTFTEYQSKIGELFTAKIDIIHDRYAFIDINDEKAFLPKSQLLQSDNLFPGKLIKVVLTDVDRESKGSQLIVSRTSPLFIIGLLKQEVPEVKEGYIEVVKIVREPGLKTKIAVRSHDSAINPIGSIIGSKGHRLQAMQAEVPGEKIEVLKWSTDTYELIESTLNQVQLLGIAEVEGTNAEGETITKHILVVDDRDLASVIGKKGSNIRLISQLVGATCDVRGVTEAVNQNLKFTKTWTGAKHVAEILNPHDLSTKDIDVTHVGEVNETNHTNVENHDTIKKQIAEHHVDQVVNVELKQKSETLEERLDREKKELELQQKRRTSRSYKKPSVKPESKEKFQVADEAINPNDVTKLQAELEALKQESLAEEQLGFEDEDLEN